jgi:hypothetical protein
MVAPVTQPTTVRLLVGVLAWPVRLSGNFRDQPKSPAWFTRGDTFLVHAADQELARPGSVVVADAAGGRWAVPAGFPEAVGADAQAGAAA